MGGSHIRKMHLYLAWEHYFLILIYVGVRENTQLSHIRTMYCSLINNRREDGPIWKSGPESSTKGMRSLDNSYISMQKEFCAHKFHCQAYGLGLNLGRSAYLPGHSRGFAPLIHKILNNSFQAPSDHPPITFAVSWIEVRVCL